MTEIFKEMLFQIDLTATPQVNPTDPSRSSYPAKAFFVQHVWLSEGDANTLNQVNLAAADWSGDLCEYTMYLKPGAGEYERPEFSEPEMPTN